MNEIKLRELISNIVYKTVYKWQINPRFSKHKLESYDNWKDDLIDKIVEKICIPTKRM